MRYLVALIIGIAVLFGVNFFAGLSSMSRPWGSLFMGAVVGITMVVILLIWEAVKPSHKDTVPAKPAMSDEERANARAERRSRLAAEAGVSLDGIDDSGQTAQSNEAAATESPNQPANSEAAENEDEVSPKSDESSIEAELNDAEPNDTEPNDTEPNDRESNHGEPNDREPNDGESAVSEPDTLAPDEYDEEATGSSLENPPTGEPGISVDALEDSESGQIDELEDVDAPEDTDSSSANDGTSRY